MGWDLADMAESVTIHAFIRAPFDQYVREGSRFWNASGAVGEARRRGRAAPGGIAARIAARRHRLRNAGGRAPAGRRSPTDQTFRLYATQEAANNAALTRRGAGGVIFHRRHQRPGARRAGHLPGRADRRGARLRPDLRRHHAKPARSGALRDRAPAHRRFAFAPKAARRSRMRGCWCSQGMRARLMSANLITGQQQIALEMVENAAAGRDHHPGRRHRHADGAGAVRLDHGGREPACWPASRRCRCRRSATTWTARSPASNALVRGPELAPIPRRAARHADRGARRRCAASTPSAAAGVAHACRSSMANLNTTVTQASRLVTSANRGYGEDSQFQRDLERMLEQITVAARVAAQPGGPAQPQPGIADPGPLDAGAMTA